MKLLIISIVILTFSLINSLDIKPVVGIVSNPFPVNSDTTNKSKISSSYSNWLMDHNIESLPLFWDYSTEELETIVPKLNGILLQGGDRDLNEKGLFEKNLDNLLELAKKHKKPVFFTCQGFEYLFFNLAMKDKKPNPLSNFNSWEVLLPAKIEDVKNSEMFKYFTEKDLEDISNTKEPAFIHYHNLGIKTDLYRESFSDKLKMTTIGLDKDGKEFVNSVESKDFNESKFFAVQFHPEKANYNYDSNTEFVQGTDNSNLQRLNHKIILGYLNHVLKDFEDVKMSIEDKKKYNVFNRMDLKPNESNEYVYVDKKIVKLEDKQMEQEVMNDKLNKKLLK